MKDYFVLNIIDERIMFHQEQLNDLEKYSLKNAERPHSGDRQRQQFHTSAPCAQEKYLHQSLINELLYIKDMVRSNNITYKVRRKRCKCEPCSVWDF
jgi:hypothetical protein